jgi:predicted phosphodiesterase
MGPFQSECLSALRAIGAQFVAGNCERDVLTGADDSSRWCHKQLAPDELGLVAAWPAALELAVDGLGRVLFCHATPRSDNENLTRLTPDEDVEAALAGTATDVVVCGHTHVQQDRALADAPRLVNAGSVGLPFQGEPGAFWAMLGPDVELRSTEYDVERAYESLASSGFPAAAAIFDDSLRGTAAAESVTAFFASKGTVQ